MIQSMLVGFLATALVISLSSCGKNKSADTTAPACTAASCEVLPGLVAANTYTRYPYGWSGPISIDDDRAFASFLRTVSPVQFCGKNQVTWQQFMSCDDLTDFARDAQVAGNAFYDGTMYIGVDRLNDNPLGEIGLNLIKNPYGFSPNGFVPAAGGVTGPTTAASGQLGPQDIYSGQFAFDSKAQGFHLTTRSVLRERKYGHSGKIKEMPRQIYDFIIKGDLAQNEVDAEIWVNGVRAAKAHLTKSFNYRANQTFLAPYQPY